MKSKEATYIIVIVLLAILLVAGYYFFSRDVSFGPIVSEPGFSEATCTVSAPGTPAGQTCSCSGNTCYTTTNTAVCVGDRYTVTWDWAPGGSGGLGCSCVRKRNSD